MTDKFEDLGTAADAFLREAQRARTVGGTNLVDQVIAEWIEATPSGKTDAFKIGWQLAHSEADRVVTLFEARFRRERRRLGLRDFRTLLALYVADWQERYRGATTYSPQDFARSSYLSDSALSNGDATSFDAGWKAACDALDKFLDGMQVFGWPLSSGTMGIGTWRSGLRAFATGTMTSVPEDDSATRWTIPTRFVRATVRYLRTGDEASAEMAFKRKASVQEETLSSPDAQSASTASSGLGEPIDTPAQTTSEDGEREAAMALYISLHEGETHPALDMQLREVLRMIRERVARGELKQQPIRVYGDVTGRLHAPRKRQIERCFAQLQEQQLPATLGFHTISDHD